MSIRARKFLLYFVTAFAWAGCGHWVAMVMKTDSRQMMMWLLVNLTVAGVLSMTCLLVAFVGPLSNRIAGSAHVYRAGYEAGQAARKTDVNVIPIRTGVYGEQDRPFTARRHSKLV